jgi:hypothetical protein
MPGAAVQVGKDRRVFRQRAPEKVDRLALQLRLFAASR